MDTKGLRALFRVLVGIGCVLAVLSVGTGGGVADAATLQDDPAGDRLSEADEIHIDVFVDENGSATFSVDYRFQNDSDGEWESLREDVESNPSAYAESEEQRWNDVLEQGDNETDRDMAIENVSVDTDTSSAPRELGHVRVTFEWTKFAYVQLSQIQIQDALVGFSFPSGTSLQIYAPEGYEIDEATPDPEGMDDESVYWVSDGDPFSSDPPMIVMMEESDGEPQSPESDVESDAESSPPWLLVPAALALLVSVTAAGWWITRAKSGATPPDDPDGDAAARGPPPAVDSSGPPRELLSNEERVLRLLEERGGRIKQQEVVSELDWTEAKTSQVVSGLREDGEIDVFRIGRENVLSLPEDEESGT